jgi:cytochrome c-type biogenesis protein CcmH/NrfG
MFWTFWVGLALVALGAAWTAGLVWRYRFAIASMDVSTDPVRRRSGMKQELFVRRLERASRLPFSRLAKVGPWFGEHVGKYLKAWHARVIALERHYKRLQTEQKSGVSGALELRRSLRAEAERLFSEGSYTLCEQRLIELVSMDPRDAEVYELLGRVYTASRQFDQAKETFSYAHQLAPKDASILVSLGELAMRDGAFAQAADFFGQAVEERPGNPKYLDFLVEASILAGDRVRAEHGVRLLREVNPENQKIPEFTDRISAL